MIRKGILFFLVMLPLLASSQGKDPRLELVFMGGVATYSGDVGGDQSKFFSDYLQKLGPAYGAGLRLHITNFLALRGNFNYAMISGADSFSNKDYRKYRNLSFRSPIYEGSLLFEVSLVNWKHIRGEKVNSTRGGRGNLYVYAGMSFFSFNPQAYYGNRWYDLQPQGTEGQGLKPGTSKYKLSSSALIAGLGYRVLLGGRWSLGFEAGLRKTNTDYLDDVSKEYYDNSELAAGNGELAATLADRTIDAEGNADPKLAGEKRGSPKVKDYYGFAQVTLAIKLGKGGGNGQGFGGNGKFRTRNRCFQF